MIFKFVGFALRIYIFAGEYQQPCPKKKCMRTNFQNRVTKSTRCTDKQLILFQNEKILDK